jgi:transposase
MANTIFMEFAMMGYQSDLEPKLFYHRINLDQRVPQNHILRKLERQIDFDFFYGQVKDLTPVPDS